jgi:hypothetical protein
MSVKRGEMNNNKDIKLEEISKTNPFRVPDSYFENFPLRMADKISQNETAKAPKLAQAWLRPQYVAVFSVALVAVIVFFGVNFFNKQNQKPLSAEELAAVYEYSALQNMDDAQLAQIIATRNEQQTPNDTISATNDSLRNSIIERLSHENIDLGSFIEAQ